VYLAPDDAKSDVILAGAVVVFGGAARAFVSSLGFYPRQGIAAIALELVWIVALTALVPVLLARYRGDGLEAFGFGGGRVGGGGVGGGVDGGGAAFAGVLVALPVAIVGVAITAMVLGSPSRALLGQLGAPTTDALSAVVRLVGVLALSLGTLVVVGFLSVRGREGYPRSPEQSLTQLVRTIGIGAAGIALVLGLARSIGPGSPLVALLSALAGAAVVLLTDRLIPSGVTVPRSSVLTPVVVVVIANVVAAGGLFRGDLVSGLYLAGLGATTAVAIAALAQTRRGTWTAAPLVVAIHWWPTCLGPLPLSGGVC
jgi:hypothetical protein